MERFAHGTLFIQQEVVEKVRWFWSTWMLFYGVIIWYISIERNDLYNCKWPKKKLSRCIWVGLLDYGRIEWTRTLSEIAWSPITKQAFLK
jgi:hypothetical protein